MNGLLQAHPPTISYGVIGCSMYENESSILCCVAKDDWGFGDVGVIDDSIVFVQRKLAFKEGALNVFNVGDSENKVYKMSRHKISGKYVGRALMTASVEKRDFAKVKKASWRLKCVLPREPFARRLSCL